MHSATGRSSQIKIYYSDHVGYVIYPPQHRRYKLYCLEDVRPMDENAGFSLLIEDTSDDARQRFEDFTKRLQERCRVENLNLE